MSFFDIFKKKSKYDKLTREEVVNAIVELENRENKLEQGIVDKAVEVERLLDLGRKEKNRDMQLLYAKKINFLKEEKESDIQRATYLLYNVKLMNKLKVAIDDNSFFVDTGNVSLGNLLSDQKALAVFLNKTLNTRINAEDVLTSADETFSDIQSAYEPNEKIYKAQNHDDELLAMFETSAQVESESQIFSPSSAGKSEEKKNGEHN